MSDVGGRPRSENGETAGIVDAGGVRGAEVDLEAGAEKISAHIRRATTRVIYLGPVERGARAIGIGDVEAVFGEGA